ncbi:cytochrome P450 [Lentithecium fluviatile CBS 122367]|uniref:Cytochrome P450 n=1 Tax=Lentithecium fluviatile CBS 122367 TaxID=1168545 RepID=A0A6G1IZU1_9PLEO|nr:cytochrome P450 [Lentithecium fluviatile CBS 122367]
MFWHGASYFTRLAAQTHYPVFTLNTMGASTVVVTDPGIAGVVQRASKHTSFYGMILEVTKRLCGFDEASMRVIRWNLDGVHGAEEGLMNESHGMVDGELSPGKNLNAMSITQLEKFASMLNELAPGDSSVDTSLMEFIKQTFTVANAYAVYGPQNPFALHPELVQSFWDWEAGMVPILADIVPALTARKAYLGRRAINAALQDFVEQGHYRSASPLIQKRVQINLKHGLSTKMAGRAELILLFGIIGNAVPTTFWMVANIFGRPGLLAQIREETAQAVIPMKALAPGVLKVNKISVAALRTKCPLLVSTFRETLREISNLASVRLVTNTHIVTAPGHRTYTLKKGSMIQIASGVIHAAPSIWGPDAHTFNPARFISSTSTNSEQFLSGSSKTEYTATALPKGVPSAAYRAFGGGSVICPGRHFAQSEILGFVALMVNMFDVADAGTGGVIGVPERDDGRIPLSVMKPKKEPQVIIKRKCGEEVVWRLEL